MREWTNTKMVVGSKCADAVSHVPVLKMVRMNRYCLLGKVLSIVKLLVLSVVKYFFY